MSNQKPASMTDAEYITFLENNLDALEKRVDSLLAESEKIKNHNADILNKVNENTETINKYIKEANEKLIRVNNLYDQMKEYEIVLPHID